MRPTLVILVVVIIVIISLSYYVKHKQAIVLSPTNSPTSIVTYTPSPTSSPTSSPTFTPSLTSSPTSSLTNSPTPTFTPSPSTSFRFTNTPSPIYTPSPTSSPTFTPYTIDWNGYILFNGNRLEYPSTQWNDNPSRKRLIFIINSPFHDDDYSNFDNKHYATDNLNGTITISDYVNGNYITVPSITINNIYADKKVLSVVPMTITPLTTSIGDYTLNFPGSLMYKGEVLLDQGGFPIFGTNKYGFIIYGNNIAKPFLYNNVDSVTNNYYTISVQDNINTITINYVKKEGKPFYPGKIISSSLLNVVPTNSLTNSLTSSSTYTIDVGDNLLFNGEFLYYPSAQYNDNISPDTYIFGTIGQGSNFIIENLDGTKTIEDVVNGNYIKVNNNKILSVLPMTIPQLITTSIGDYTLNFPGSLMYKGKVLVNNKGNPLFATNRYGYIVYINNIINSFYTNNIDGTYNNQITVKDNVHQITINAVGKPLYRAGGEGSSLLWEPSKTISSSLLNVRDLI